MWEGEKGESGEARMEAALDAQISELEAAQTRGAELIEAGRLDAVAAPESGAELVFLRLQQRILQQYFEPSCW